MISFNKRHEGKKPFVISFTPTKKIEKVEDSIKDKIEDQFEKHTSMVQLVKDGIVFSIVGIAVSKVTGVFK